MSDMMWEERPGPIERARRPIRVAAQSAAGLIGLAVFFVIATLFLALFAAAWASLVVWAWNAGWWV